MKKLLTTLCALALSSAALFAGDFPDISIAELNKAIAEKKVTPATASNSPALDRKSVV